MFDRPLEGPRQPSRDGSVTSGSHAGLCIHAACSRSGTHPHVSLGLWDGRWGAPDWRSDTCKKQDQQAQPWQRTHSQSNRHESGRPSKWAAAPHHNEPHHHKRNAHVRRATHDPPPPGGGGADHFRCDLPTHYQSIQSGGGGGHIIPQNHFYVGLLILRQKCWSYVFSGGGQLV